jgi:hypothetical protein
VTLTAARLREVLDYDPETGRFVWIKHRSKSRVGTPAGYVSTGDGYIRVFLAGQKFLGHRLAWLFIHDEWPDGQLDHKSLDRADNRLSNLRPATPTEQNGNQGVRSNNTSGVKGVSWSTPLSKWKATLTVQGSNRHLGYFIHIDDAAAAYEKAANDHFGEFARCA